MAIAKNSTSQRRREYLAATEPGAEKRINEIVVTQTLSRPGAKQVKNTVQSISLTATSDSECQDAGDTDLIGNHFRLTTIKLYSLFGIYIPLQTNLSLAIQFLLEKLPMACRVVIPQEGFSF